MESLVFGKINRSGTVNRKPLLLLTAPFSIRWLKWSLLLALFQCQSAVAEYTLNFDIVNSPKNPLRGDSIADIDCNTENPNTPQYRGSCGSGYFMQEVVNDGSNSYYHVIIGDIQNDDFAQEFFIRNLPLSEGTWFGAGGGPMYGWWKEAPISSSYYNGKKLISMTNPLGKPSISTNVTGNPSRVHMRQVIQDSEISQDFVKASENNKPSISQYVADSDIESNFVIDMSNGDYSAFSDPVQVVNTLTVYDNGKPFGAGDFDMDRMGDRVTITAGDYSYREGSGAGGSYGDYVYDYGDFDIYTINWQEYCIVEQNPDRLCQLGAGLGPPEPRTGSITLRGGNASDGTTGW